MFARLIDNIHGVARYFLNFFIISFGVISTMDFSSLKRTYPHWERQIYLISHNASYIVLTAALLLLASEIFHHIFCKKSIKVLNRELDKLTQQNSIISENIEAIFNGFLYDLAKKLNFDVKNQHNERVTLYVHDNKKSFIPCARYSNNPELQKKGRVEYPDNQGCISKAWQHDWWFDGSFDSKMDYAQYNLDEYKIPKLTTRQMKMRSNLYAAKRIKNEYGKPLAVIVVESLEKDFLKEDELKKQLGQGEGFFAHIIEQLWDHIPKPSDAKQRGL